MITWRGFLNLPLGLLTVSTQQHVTLTALTKILAYAFYNTSTSVASMVGKGLRALIGAHGENPVGHNYHAELSFAKAGGLSNYEVSMKFSIETSYSIFLGFPGRLH